MKFNGTHKFKVSSEQVFNAILNPEVLKASIPGCSSVTYVDANNILANITTQLPGFKGPYEVTINIVDKEASKYLKLQVERNSISAVSQINLADEADGALLTYDTTADLKGSVASLVNNPIGQTAAKSALGSFFKGLEKALV